jgi:DNA (cytosine-5)-methyltransferase 1
MKAVELFAGAAGLALGVAQAGFRHVAVIERDHFSCETIRENQKRKHRLVKDWPVFETDVRKFDYSKVKGPVDLLCAGVPCQPFSVAGKGQAHKDERDMFAEVVRAARHLRPKAILIENVPGLRRSRFNDYFEYLILAISTPGLARETKQSWQQHLASLRKRSEVPEVAPLRYDVHVHMVNAADYGVPQLRERVFIIAFRSDLQVRWKLPSATHSLEALLWAQWKSRAYWRKHGLSRKRRGTVSRRVAAGIGALTEARKKPKLRPWATVRDAFVGLPKLRRSRKVEELDNHYLVAGARSYEGHCGSLLDEPSKTLKAGSHGVPGGENSLARGGNRIRYFSVRECARLQAFPDDYVFVGPWIRRMSQIGNAVPVTLGQKIASAIASRLTAKAKKTRAKRLRVLPFQRGVLSRRAS